MEDRIERLESLFALQERSIEKLNEVLFEQQKQIDALESQLRGLAAKVKRVDDVVGQGEFDDAPPPHYGG